MGQDQRFWVDQQSEYRDKQELIALRKRVPELESALTRARNLIKRASLTWQEEILAAVDIADQALTPTMATQVTT